MGGGGEGLTLPPPSPQGGALIWAPSKAETCINLMNGVLTQWNAAGESPLHLLVPLPALTGGPDGRAILDLWTHTSLGDRWKQLVRNVALFPFPMQVLRDGGKGPRTDWMGLAVVTMAVPGGWNIPQVMAPLDALPGINAHIGFMVDFPLEEEAKVMHCCLPLAGNGWAISETRRSPGHYPGFPRLRVILTPDVAWGTLDRQGLMARIRNAIGSPAVALAGEDIYNNGLAPSWKHTGFLTRDTSTTWFRRRRPSHPNSGPSSPTRALPAGSGPVPKLRTDTQRPFAGDSLSTRVPKSRARLKLRGNRDLRRRRREEGFTSPSKPRDRGRFGHPPWLRLPWGDSRAWVAPP